MEWQRVSGLKPTANPARFQFSGDGPFSFESMAGMRTYYRPSERRGKVWVYRSLDPDESKRGRWRVIAYVLIFVTLLALSFYFHL